MTERDWLEATRPDAMLTYLASRPELATERKLRLFAVACCRRLWPLMPEEHLRAAVAVIERWADGRAGEVEAARARNTVVRAPGPVGKAVYSAASRKPGISLRSVCDAAVEAVATAAVRKARASGGSQRDAWDTALHAAERAQAELIRECFGNPFRIARIDPQWLTWHGAVVAGMTEAVYEQHAFDRLPILADALEEAGCDEAAILDHCRKPAAHVRGCWVIDLLRKGR